ncbi:hypothetical protein FRC12_022250 [Ceratobasidium sp. 428]|nr:hypothetical protein FRC12_022250 [Ceratobasidium sp. 428]
MPMHRNTTVYAGYYISREGLNSWSEREEKDNEGWKKCLTRKKGLVDLAIDSYLWRKKIGHLVKQQFPPKPEHGGCGSHCWNSNFIFYRRCGVTKSLANFKPKDWERFKETPADREVKKQLEDILHIELSEWTTIVWAPRGMLYEPTEEMVKQGGADLIERLENGPPGPCGDDPPLED